jgi:hypothetical protein
MLQRAGLAEAGIVVALEEHECDGGRCPECGRGVELRTCAECGESAWVLDCEHRMRPAWLQRGRRDGSQRGRVFCGDCADVLPEKIASA